MPPDTPQGAAASGAETPVSVPFAIAMPMTETDAHSVFPFATAVPMQSTGMISVSRAQMQAATQINVAAPSPAPSVGGPNVTAAGYHGSAHAPYSLAQQQQPPEQRLRSHLPSQPQTQPEARPQQQQQAQPACRSSAYKRPCPEYKCKRCGEPKKGHICPMRAPGLMGVPVGSVPDGNVGDGVARKRTVARKEWAADEDEYIIRCVKELGSRWRVIASALPGRTDDAVRNRWNRLQELQRDTSSSDDDAGGPGPEVEAMLCDTGVSFETSDEAPNQAPDLSRISAERTQWSETEDAKIIAAVGELGHKWNLIADALPGRTEHAIRNRWSRLQMLRKWPPTSGRSGRDLIVSSYVRNSSENRLACAPSAAPSASVVAP